jgi:sugar transferase (PEP-CTERM/EpsH1 system associated)
LKVLFLTSRFPWPLDRGDRLTVHNILRALRGHRVTFACFTDGTEPPDARRHVEEYCERLVTVDLPRARSWVQAWMGLLSPVPSQVAYYRSARMRSTLAGLHASERFDAILVHAVRTVPVAPEGGDGIRVLFQGDAVGIVLAKSLPFAPPWKRPGIAWEARRADDYLVACTHRFNETWVLSRSDRDHMRVRGAERVEVIRHGVDESLFDLRRAPDDVPHLMFLGNLSVPHNVDAATFAALEVFPRVRAARPQARLTLAGAQPTAAVRSLGSQPGVQVTGFVPDLSALWRRVHVSLAPVRFSSGIQNKVLEAMAAGVPVVATTSVAEGIEARSEDHLLVADSAEALAAAVLRVLDDPAAASERATRARAYVRAHFSWGSLVRRLEALVETRAGVPGC